MGEMDTSPLRLRLARAIGHLRLPVSTERIVRRLAPPGFDTGTFEVPFAGVRYRGDIASYIDWSVYFFGAYAAHELSLLDRLSRRFLRQRGRLPVFADVGANVGNHTLFMSSRSSRVIAFEPFGRVREKLIEQVQRNRLDNVEVHPFALGERDRQTAFYHLRSHNNEGLGTTVPQANWATTTVEQRAGDNLPELADVDILKIDVEGAEASVLAGLASTLHAKRPAILMELSEASRRAFGSEAGLRAALYEGASVVAVRRGRVRPFALRRFRFDETDEVLVTSVS